MDYEQLNAVRKIEVDQDSLKPGGETWWQKKGYEHARITQLANTSLPATPPVTTEACISYRHYLWGMMQWVQDKLMELSPTVPPPNSAASGKET